MYQDFFLCTPCVMGSDVVDSRVLNSIRLPIWCGTMQVHTIMFKFLSCYQQIKKCNQSKVGTIRNQYPYVINYVSAKKHKIFGFQRKKILGGGSRTMFGAKGSQSFCKCA